LRGDHPAPGADWPGFFPGGPATIRLLIEAGADEVAAGIRWVRESALAVIAGVSALAAVIGKRQED
jgi:hypothetical protein